MNKYNMPPPFGPADKESITTLLKRKHDDLLASDESELEDEEDSGKISKETEIQEKKVKQARLERIAAEKQKLATASTTTTVTLPMNNKTTPTNKIKINIGSHHKKELTESQKLIRDKCITETEREKLPAFKNCQRGTLSNKLYIKNLAKQVTEDDLNTLYSNFSQDIQINLMKKGKLRGQAFITFPQEDIANTALDCTNGYMLYDRPIAVLFGKPAALVNE
jgi:U11/U12 small nuclear ribonucleoprotein SNRNP65